MPTSVVLPRYAFFFILAAAFAVQASVAAWNIQIEESLTLHSQLDAYLIFCGAFGLLVLFPIVCIDIARKNAVFACVWFEILWLAVFFVLQTAGAAALTALLPQLSCSQKSRILRDPSCQSTNVLAGITWTITVIVLIYMTTLIICAILHHDSHPGVWRSGVRDFPWFEHVNRAERLVSPPCSPSRWCYSSTRQKEPKQKQQQPPIVVAPKPRREMPAPVWASYQVEPFAADSFDGPRYPRAPAPPPPAIQQMQARRGPMVSLYPTYMDATLPPVVPATLPPNVKPAGNWPSTSSSPRPLRQQHRTRASQQTTTTTQRDRESPESPAVDLSGRQPRGPRTRPTPLDLSKAAAYR